MGQAHFPQRLLSARAQVAIPQVTGPAAPVKTQVAGSAEPRSRPGTGRRWRSTRPARLRARHHPQEQGPGLPPAPWASILESVRGAVGPRSVIPGHCKGHNYLTGAQGEAAIQSFGWGGCGLRRGLRRSLRPLTDTSFSLGGPGRGRRCEPAGGFLCFSRSLTSQEGRVCRWRPSPGPRPRTPAGARRRRAPG